MFTSDCGSHVELAKLIETGSALVDTQGNLDTQPQTGSHKKSRETFAEGSLSLRIALSRSRGTPLTTPAESTFDVCS